MTQTDGTTRHLYKQKGMREEKNLLALLIRVAITISDIVKGNPYDTFSLRLSIAACIYMESRVKLTCEWRAAFSPVEEVLTSQLTA